MSKLVRWNTPFTDKKHPSVGLVITTNPDETDIIKRSVPPRLKAIVAPEGINAYPKYLVNFFDVIAFTCFEEAYAPERDFDTVEIEEKNLCAYQYLDSPWLQSYKLWEPLYFGNETTNQFSHYLIFGGDNNIEVITGWKPTIKMIKEKTILKIEREV